jgi:hypothetical protein
MPRKSARGRDESARGRDDKLPTTVVTPRPLPAPWVGWHAPRNGNADHPSSLCWRRVCEADTYEECLTLLQRTMQHHDVGWTAIMRRNCSPADVLGASAPGPSWARRRALTAHVRALFLPGRWLTLARVQALLPPTAPRVQPTTLGHLLCHLAKQGVLQARRSRSKHRVEYALADPLPTPDAPAG